MGCQFVPSVTAGVLRLAHAHTETVGDLGFGPLQEQSTLSLGGQGRNEVLTVATWTPDEITAALPTDLPDGSYTVTVNVDNTAVGECTSSASVAIGDTDPALLFAKLDRTTAHPGQQLTISCEPPADPSFVFSETRHGPLRLLRNDASPAPGPFDVTGWNSSVLHLRLPTANEYPEGTSGSPLHTVRFGQNTHGLPFTLVLSPADDLANDVVFAAAVADVFRFAAVQPDLPPGTPAVFTLHRHDGDSTSGRRLNQLLAGSADVTLGWRIETVDSGGEILHGTTTGALPVPSVGSSESFPSKPLLAKPRSTYHDGVAGNHTLPSTSTWRFQAVVTVTVTGIPGRSGDATSEIRSPVFRQLPLRYPALVLTSRKRWWDGPEYLVFLPPFASAFLPDPTMDRRDGGRAVGEARDAVEAALTTLITALKALAVFADLPGASELGNLEKVHVLLRDTDSHNLVLTAATEVDDLGTLDPGWWNAISSLYMVGLPGSGTLQLFEDNEQRSYKFEVRMPNGHVAASMWTLHERAFEPGFTSEPVVTEPAPRAQPDISKFPKHWPSGKTYFGNITKSTRWV